MSRRSRGVGNTRVVLAGSAVILAGTAGPFATDSAAAAAGAPCSPVVARFGVVPAVGGSLGSAVTAVTVTGLSLVNCEGSTVKVLLRGNASGDPAAPADLLLSTADSRLDPCTQVPLVHPGVVTAGAVTLSLCLAGGPAAYASLRELTEVSAFVDGIEVPVIGVTGTTVAGGSAPGGGPGPVPTTTPVGAPVAPPAGPGNVGGPAPAGPGDAPAPVPTRVLGVEISPPSPPGSSPAGGILAFTGSHTEAVWWGGLSLLVAGVVLRLSERRRSSRSTGR